MGHSTPTVTANVYSDLHADELDHVATGLDQLYAAETQKIPTDDVGNQTGHEADKKTQLRVHELCSHR